MRAIILGDDEDTNQTGEVLAVEVGEGKEEEILECKVIGLCGITGKTNDQDPSRTMKLTRKMGGIPLMVLVDSGASHNFISPEVVSSLGLEVKTAH